MPCCIANVLPRSIDLATSYVGTTVVKQEGREKFLLYRNTTISVADRTHPQTINVNMRPWLPPSNPQ